MPLLKIVIERGCLRAVYSSNENVQIELIDADCPETPAAAAAQKTAIEALGNNPQFTEIFWSNLI